MVLSSGGVFRGVERRPAKLGRPHHQRAVQQAAPLQVRDQTRDWLIDGLRQLGVGVHVAVRIPVAGRAGTGVDQLDEAHAALDQAPGYQALPAKALGVAVLDAVEVVRCVGFARDIERLGSFPLHPEGRLEGADACFEGAIARCAPSGACD